MKSLKKICALAAIVLLVGYVAYRSWLRVDVIFRTFDSNASIFVARAPHHWKEINLHPSNMPTITWEQIIPGTSRAMVKGGYYYEIEIDKRKKYGLIAIERSGEILLK